MIEVLYQRGLYLPELDLWLDPQRAKPRAFVSHAHGDHFARHQSALCSPVTAALIHARFKLPVRRIDSQVFQLPFERNGFRFRLLPAGHIPGSAMLHLTRLHDGATLLYTGDFKTRTGRTAEAVSFLPADTLILETTFGLPTYRFPAETEVETHLLRFVADAFATGKTPVLLAYSLGKAQEAIALLAARGIPVVQHPAVAEMTAACRVAGVPGLPEPLLLTDPALPGHVVIAPPHTLRSKLMRALTAPRAAMLTGWALQPGAKYRYRVDEVIALSDHADHPGLLECIRQVGPKKILTVHGYTKEFAAELRSRQLDAWCAQGGDQLELPMGEEPDNAGSD